MSWTKERARVGALSRSRPANDPELIEARRNLKANRLEEHIREQVASWPPLTETQIRRVQALLQSPKIGGGHQ